MSIVHLHSKGSSPNNFTNYFKQGLNLPRNTKVRMLGYSINVSKSEKEEITATEGNNKYMVIIGGAHSIFCEKFVIVIPSVSPPFPMLQANGEDFALKIHFITRDMLMMYFFFFKTNSFFCAHYSR